MIHRVFEDDEDAQNIICAECIHDIYIQCDEYCSVLRYIFDNCTKGKNYDNERI